VLLEVYQCTDRSETGEALDSDLCKARALWSRNSLSHVHTPYYCNTPIFLAV